MSTYDVVANSIVNFVAIIIVVITIIDIIAIVLINMLFVCVRGMI